MVVRQTTRLRRTAPPRTLQPVSPKRGRRPPARLALILIVAITLSGGWALRGLATRGPVLSDAIEPVPAPAVPGLIGQSGTRWLAPASAGPIPGLRSPGIAGSTTSMPLQSAALQADLDAWASGRDGVYGAVAIDLASGTRLSLNADEEFPPASLHKLLILAEAYRQIEAGRIGLADTLTIEAEDAAVGEPPGGLPVGETVTIDRALGAMTDISSNSAAAALTRRLGPAAITAVPDRLGLRDTRYDPDRDRDAVTTPADMATYFQHLAEGRLVSRAASQAMIDRLARSRLNDRLPAALPPGTPVAHKTGDRDTVVHDAGIVYGPRGPIVIALLSQDVGYGRAAADLRHLTRLLYGGLTGEDLTP